MTTFEAAIKQLASVMKLDGDFAGHSFGCGAACDLWATNVPIVVIMKMGRWKSDAVRLHLRDEGVTGIKIAAAFNGQRHGSASGAVTVLKDVRL